MIRRRWSRTNTEVIKSLLDLLAAAEDGELVAVCAVAVLDDGSGELCVAGEYEAETMSGLVDELGTWIRETEG